MPQTQSTASTRVSSIRSSSVSRDEFEDSGSTENNMEIGSPFTKILNSIRLKNNSLMTKIRTDAEFKGNGSEMQGIRSETGGQGSQGVWNKFLALVRIEFSQE
ncbi:hypothetical protein FGG08_000619 [Glutinoglossum americanum]|uniref:Uncharacterized protein n=1 Tax=Glutinoglossum americanum TaxID=1670608 RepID=A0A9P8ICN7_9PEZI|nr:hypothetical protein FGG08_000619 [Glutinoglossum americanum]